MKIPKLKLSEWLYLIGIVLWIVCVLAGIYIAGHFVRKYW